ncbi:glycosyltransferase family 1 protein [Novosphingobium sp.]|uniref:glycosyltransferase family 4 protein n=1 Tax=Novosphingobium sp. TaxID=1874826 RepID=UPI0025DBAC45|nr:glycosyltransferase family 1 protein [Novosphingobium sp.]
MMDVVLDISRLISRIRHSTPSGVDRVEMAYARGLAARHGTRLAFSAVHPCGLYGRIPTYAAYAYLDRLERNWESQENAPPRISFATIIPQLIAMLPISGGIGSADVYIQVSPHHLADASRVRRILAVERARFLCMVHDLIPIEFPEYARPNGAAQHRKRIETVATALTETRGAAIVNSTATGRSLRRWLKPNTPIHVALLGTVDLAKSGFDEQERGPVPYFVCLGTIEPRKNHLLLLHLWRHFAETLSPDEIPRLYIVGRRGWENEQVIDLLDRCSALRGHVIELGGYPDRSLAGLLRAARALLMPSFAEGFGMPVAEALSMGTPVVCSNLAALNEVGGAVPDYIDPLDGAAWKAAVLDHARNGPMARAQSVRLSDWHNPTWEEHMAVIDRAIIDLKY